MREIKFRGKRTDNGEWVYGFLFELSWDGCPILCIGIEPLSANDYSEIYKSCYDEVDPATVGQYTGLKDKNGVEIYEGDVLRKDDCFIGYVEYCAPLFYRVPLDKWSIDHGVKETVVSSGTFVTSEVIGNIHDNPDLLRGADNE
jgi:uncharacterized phage protein (TIGR01671 family)